MGCWNIVIHSDDLFSFLGWYNTNDCFKHKLLKKKKKAFTLHFLSSDGGNGRLQGLTLNLASDSS